MAASPPDLFNLRVHLTLLAAACGGFLFQALGVPAPWFGGPIISVALLSALGAEVASADLVRHAAFILLGMGIGGNLSPETLKEAASWPLSILLLCGSVLASIFCMRAALKALLKWDRPTRVFAAIPGSFSVAAAFAGESRADINKVIGSHLTRLLMIVMIFPPVFARIDIHGGGAKAQAAAAATGAPELLLVMAACTVAGLLFLWLRAPAGALLGAMLASLLLHGGGLTAVAVPAPLQMAAYAAIGAHLGTRVTALRASFGWSALLGGAISLSVGLAIALGFALIAAPFLDLPLEQLILAYAPGGIEVMVILALTIGYDPAFIGLHQTCRYVLIALLIPHFARRLRRAPEGD